MADLYATSNLFEGVMFLATSVFLYWRFRQGRGLRRITKLTSYVMGLLGLFMLLVYSGMAHFTGPANPAVIMMGHVFIFGATAVMWKFVTAFIYSSYERYDRVFWGMGAASIAIGAGIFAGVVPPIVGRLWPILLVPSGIAVSAVGYITARELRGADGQKLAIFATASLDALFISAVLNNATGAGVIGPLPPIANNLLFGLLFVLSVFWGEVKGVNW